MNQPRAYRLGLCVALLVGLGASLGGQAGGKNEYFKGKVVPLARALEKAGIKVDPDAAALELALLGEDGKVYPLVKDAGSRMFYLDNSVRDRPMRLTGRLVADGKLLQVVNVHSYKDGRLCDIYYWCEICSIRSSELSRCDCCGGPTELCEEPIKK
jgi:hypothetical protein